LSNFSTIDDQGYTAVVGYHYFKKNFSINFFPATENLVGVRCYWLRSIQLVKNLSPSKMFFKLGTSSSDIKEGVFC